MAELKEDKFYYFLDTLNVGVMLINSNLEVVYINKWLSSRLPLAELRTGMKLNEVYDLDEFPRLKVVLNEAREYKRSSHISEKLNKLPFSLKAGDAFLSYNLSVSSLSQSDSGQIITIQFLDITSVKERERYIANKQEEIDRQKEASFTQQRLASLGEMTSGIAHEINNPLSILKMSNKMVAKAINSDEVNKELIKKMVNDSDGVIDRIAKLITGIRSLSEKVDKRSMEMSSLMENLDVAAMMINEKIKSEEIDVIYDKDDLNLKHPLKVIKSLIVEIFFNLFNNSIIAISELEEKWIKITAEVMNDEKLIIRFSDSGKGIEPDVAKKMFDPFYTTLDIGKGVGLGLSSIYTIMEGHNGSIKYDDTSEHTCFVLEFPIN